jgi:hypothetical protein
MLTEASATGTTFKFATKLSENLPTGYKVKIDLNNGKGLVAMTCSGRTCSLSTNALPKVDSPTYKIGIYDAKGVLQGTAIDGSYFIVSFSTGYAKISNLGKALPDTAVLGTGSNDWACTKDNKTGLTWEVKTNDAGLRSKFWRYSWYKPIGYNGGDVGYTDATQETPDCSTKDNCNTYAFTNAVNAKGLCGKKDWRMPTADELMTLVYCSDGKYDTDGSCTNATSGARPTIKLTYFPYTLDDLYWSSSPNASSSSDAWLVDFYFGFSDSDRGKDFLNYVRLVKHFFLF